MGVQTMEEALTVHGNPSVTDGIPTEINYILGLEDKGRSRLQVRVWRRAARCILKIRIMVMIDWRNVTYGKVL